MKKEGVDHNKLPNKEVNNFRLMTQLIELKKHKKAYKICEQILKKYPKNGETLSVKGYLLNLMDQKNKEEAFKLIKEGIKNNLSSNFCWYLYGCLYKIYKNYDEALKCFMKSIKLNRFDFKALKEACIVLLYLKKYEQFKDLRIDMYNDSVKNIKDKAVLVFAYHLTKSYEKCYVIIKQIDNELINDNELSINEKHDLLVYLSEILLEGKKYKECLNFLKKYESVLLDTLWYYQMLGLLYLYQEDFKKSNFYFKKAFSLNYENINILLLILYTEKDYYIDCHNKTDKNDNNLNDCKENNTNSMSINEEGKKCLSSLFYLDYKNEHKENEKVILDNNVKILLHDLILDIYGSDRNLKLLSYVEKNIINDYISHNLDMKKYDIYSVSQFNNFVNINLIHTNNFIDSMDIDNMDDFIHTLNENIKKENKNIINNNNNNKKKNNDDNDDKMNLVKSNYNYHQFNNLHFSELFGVDLPYCYKKKYEKDMDKLYYFKIKNLNEQEEECLEKYFNNLQQLYKNSNLLKIIPLYFFNENKFSLYVEQLIRSLCFQKSLTIFNYFKPLLTFKNINIILFLLHKYIDYYDKCKDICPFVVKNDINIKNDGIEECAENSKTTCNGHMEIKEELNNASDDLKDVNNLDTSTNFEKREDMEHDDKMYSKNEDKLNGTLQHNNNNNNNNNKMNKKNENVDEEEDDENIPSGLNDKDLEKLIEKNVEIKDLMGISSPLGNNNVKKKKDNKKNNNNNNENKEIKLDLKKTCLTNEEKKEYFIICIYSFIIQLYDYINCTDKALELIEKCIKSIEQKNNKNLIYELIFIKGLIYKRNGNYLGAYKYFEECRNVNIGDRYINTKTIKTCLKCGLIKDAKKMATIFTNPLDNNFIKNINETQCFWLEYNISLSYINNHPNIHLIHYLKTEANNIYDFKNLSNSDNQHNMNNITRQNGKLPQHNNNDNDDTNNVDNTNKIDDMINQTTFNLKKSILLENDINSKNIFQDYSKGLHLLHMGHKQFIDIHEDQICFYYYTMRKMLFKTYRHLLHMTGHLFSSRFYRRFGKSLIRILLDMHDFKISGKVETNKGNKKKNKTNNNNNNNNVLNQEENVFYEHIQNEPLDNAMIYMNTFLSQPNIDISVHRLNYEIEKRKGKDYIQLINIISKMKSIFPHHNYHHKLAPVISHYLHTVPIDDMSDNDKEEVKTKLNELFNLNHSEYDKNLLKQIRKEYIEDFINFFEEHKKGDLCYYQSALEIYMDCNEKIDQKFLKKVDVNLEKNKLERCFKFLRFLIKHKEKHLSLSQLIDPFKASCRKIYPLATAFE
ncbi:putative N-alpha-acetyltransferase 15, NatA auxiliary subunit [Plasmodium gaboni]|uniref:Putative N-alpha-acetyltransferase 15, NatA auxiliary subunit n=1 Tax=Plasmodium gaboni TaxID=647221 RepID=A0A151LH10_9APIC|nr:putative N-alpha-acetyltransferase 15, NatA auxiliary subunit [Plasmodium gaboni]KYN98223.1 putative N-alpha-acetyltransferase 15, NatA auxiliary subunit [Plasmodium gaboni]